MEQLKAVCSVCRKEVRAGTGLLAVDLREVTAEDVREFDDMPAGRVPWRVAHYRCHPDLDALTYGIELSRAGTARELLVWTAHLAEKAWLPRTDWMLVVRGAGEHGRLDTGLWVSAAANRAPDPWSDPSEEY